MAAQSLLGSLTQSLNEETVLLCLQTAERAQFRLRRAGSLPVPLADSLRILRLPVRAKTEQQEIASEEVTDTLAEILESSAGKASSSLAKIAQTLDREAGARLGARNLVEQLDLVSNALWDQVQADTANNTRDVLKPQRGLNYAEVLRIATTAGVSDLEIRNALFRCRVLFDDPQIPGDGEETKANPIIRIDGKLKRSKDSDEAKPAGKKAKRRLPVAISLADFSGNEE